MSSDPLDAAQALASHSRSSKQQFRQSSELDGLEDIEKYCPGGFHPVALGDILADKFKILHKLGSGGFSTVWLARDLQQNLNVAVKILVADAPEDEFRTLLHMRSTVTPHPN